MLKRKPRIGDTIVFRKSSGQSPDGTPEFFGEITTTGKVLRIEGNLCWCRYDDGSVDPFIWNFPRDGMLNLCAEIVEDQAPLFQLDAEQHP